MKNEKKTNKLGLSCSKLSTSKLLSYFFIRFSHSLHLIQLLTFLTFVTIVIPKKLVKKGKLFPGQILPGQMSPGQSFSVNPFPHDVSE